MRTNIVLDEELVKEAFKYANVRSKRELVSLALREFVEHHRRRNLMEIYGKGGVREDYDYVQLRIGQAK